MSFMARVVACFPLTHILFVISMTLSFIWNPSLISAIAVLFAIYGFPLLSFHLHNVFFPLKEGLTDFGVKSYNPWWGAYQIQIIFFSFPALEAVLILIPGLFSQWLRLWGSRVGRNVYFAPRFEVLDRSLLQVGDNVVFGANVAMSQHAITPRKKSLYLYVRKIEIGDGAFIGAESRIGPGVKIDAGVRLGYRTYVAAGKKLRLEKSS